MLIETAIVYINNRIFGPSSELITNYKNQFRIKNFYLRNIGYYNLNSK